MDNFNLQKYLIENKLTQAQQLKENEITPADITRILRRTDTEQDLYVKDWDELTPEMCNDGFCDIFAEKFREEYPGAELWGTKASLSAWSYGHVWLNIRVNFMMQKLQME